MTFKRISFVSILFIAHAALSQVPRDPVIKNDTLPFNVFQDRPRYHATPPAGWMSDPNGMVYYDGEYHLCYQHVPAPQGSQLHWGHAVSRDLFHWKALPLALFPDSLLPFSGSAVVDQNNSAGFQIGKEKALVAIFTEFSPATKNQVQSIAYSIDKGRTWKRYAGNPVLPNTQQLKDFRDPKVFWYGPNQKWIMTVACGDHVEFYSSDNLKKWIRESEFGKRIGAHSGAWECPDLSEISVSGTNKKKWLLISSLVPGGPTRISENQQLNSATQYFVGEFDGRSFVSQDTLTRWLDYGADNYASVSWSNVRNRLLVMGWMNNWQYAGKVPTTPWKGNMTLPKEQTLKEFDGRYTLMTTPARELKSFQTHIFSQKNIQGKGTVFQKTFRDVSSAMFDITVLPKDSTVNLSLENNEGEHVDIGYDKNNRRFYIDRTAACRCDFDSFFVQRHFVDVNGSFPSIRLQVYYDVSTIEVFINDGRWVISERVFPRSPFDKIRVTSADEVRIQNVDVFTIRPIDLQAQ